MSQMRLRPIICEICGGTEFVEKNGLLVCIHCDANYPKHIEESEEAKEARILRISRLDDAEKELRMSPPHFDIAEDKPLIVYGTETLSREIQEKIIACIENAAFAANIILIGNGKRDTTFNHSVILKKELNIHGSRNALRADFIKNIGLVKDGKADVMKMVSGIYGMENALDAFRALSNNDGTLAKLLIRIGE